MKSKTSSCEIRIIVKRPNAGKVRVIKRVDVKGNAEQPDLCYRQPRPEEITLNAGDRVLLALKGDSAYPADIAEKSTMRLGTVKNELTRLRKRGLVEYTGETEPRTKAREVRLTEHSRVVMGVTSIHRDGDTVTPGANGGGKVRLLNERKANDDRDA